MRFPTMWYVRPAKTQISLHISAVWSEPLLVQWIFYEYQATDWISIGVSKLKRRLHRLVWVYTCQNATLLEITCPGSNVLSNECTAKTLIWLGCCQRLIWFFTGCVVLHWLVKTFLSSQEWKMCSRKLKRPPLLPKTSYNTKKCKFSLS